jgi:outer membrane protein
LISKIVTIFLLLLSSLYSKEITLSINEAIQLVLKNNGLNKISRLNLEIAKVQYKQALSANYPTIDTLYYLNRDNKDAIYQQRGKFKFPSDIVGALSLMGITSSSISADIDTVSKGRDTAVGKLEVNYPLFILVVKFQQLLSKQD